MTKSHPADAVAVEPVWTPKPNNPGRMRDFMTWVNGRGHDFATYDELWQWSTTEIEGFWEAVWDYFDVVHTQRHTEVLAKRSMPATGWFEGARLNYAATMLRRRGPRPAVIAVNDSGAYVELSWDELREQVAAAAAAFRLLGVRRGDRIGAIVPNTIDGVVAHLAAIAVGAVWANVAPETGIDGVVDRLAQVDPKLLVAVDSYAFGGKVHDRTSMIADLQRRLPSVAATVRIAGPGLHHQTEFASEAWTDLLDDHRGAPLEFEPMAFEDPIWILFTSGTTGLPKAIVHSHGGMLLDYLVKLGLHLDLGEDDRILWYTSSGWAVWNFLIGCLGLGTTIVLYDGSPGYPSRDVLWDVAARARVTAFGTSPAYLANCIKRGSKPTDGRNLEALRRIMATGAPVTQAIYRWVDESFPSGIWMSVTYGSTDTGSSFAGPSALDPVFAGEVQKRALGVRLEAYSADGRPLVDEPGEMVITAPMPTMPLCFWGDDDGSRYHETYFSTYDGVWWQGDTGIITSRGGVVVQGRSDATINRGGVRIGASDIYRAILTEPELQDAVAVDVPDTHTGDSSLALFVLLAEDVELDDALTQRLRSVIRERCSPRHVPDLILQVPSLPRTLTGKAMEVPIKRVLMGVDLDQAVSRATVEAPEAFDYFVELARTWPPNR